MLQGTFTEDRGGKDQVSKRFASERTDPSDGLFGSTEMV